MSTMGDFLITVGAIGLIAGCPWDGTFTAGLICLAAGIVLNVLDRIMNRYLNKKKEDDEL